MRLTFRRHRRFIIFTSAVVLLIFLLVIFQKTAPVGFAMNGLRGGLALAGNGIGSVIERVFSSKAKLLEENGRLHDEVERYAAEAAAAAMLADENAALASLLNYTKSSPVPPLATRVMSRTSAFGGEYILLDRGETSGIALGDPVIVGEGMFIGRIQSVSSSSSVARLVTDSQSKVGVRILNDVATIGIAEGQDGVLLKVSFVPQSVDLQINQLIMTSGLDPETPAGLVVGSVKEVQQDEHDPFQEALIEPLTDLRRLTIVGVLPMSSL